VDPAASPDDPAAVEAMREERARRRLRQTVRDMLLSMLVVSGAVLVLYAPWNRNPPETVHVVDPAPVVEAARQAQSWPVLAPVGLPATWRPTSSRLELASDGESIVHLGYLSPTDDYAGLEQSATHELVFISDRTIGGVKGDDVTIGGVVWTRYESPDGKHRSLVRAASGATYVVTGNGEWPEVETFAASLRGA
jgi:hypothetical protein